MEISKLRRVETMLVLATASVVFYLIFDKFWLVYLALAFGLIGVFVGPLSELITRVWLGFSEVLGKIMSKVILAIVFYLFLTPLAFLSRLFGKVSLQLKKKEDTYYTTRNHTYTAEDMKQMW